LPIFLMDTFGSASIGVFLKVTDKFIIAPPQIVETKLRKLEGWFKIQGIRANISGSVLVGCLACANSNGVILPHHVRDEEITALKSLSDVNIAIAETKRTAYGNLILTNDHGAIVDPRLGKEDMKMVSDTLGVEVSSGEIGGLPYVGSLATATNKGAMSHPMIKPEEQALLKDVLKVPVGVGTINCGIPYIATGLIGNSNVAVAGSLTTGPELFMIEEALGVTD